MGREIECTKASLGFTLIKLHGNDAGQKLTLDFKMYNPRVPPKKAVTTMAVKMGQKCLSDEHYLLAAVSRNSITNITRFHPTYSSKDYHRLSPAEFTPSTTVFFLTGGTRRAASEILHQNLLRGKKKASGNTTNRTTPLFKAANWVVHLYDFGMWCPPLYIIHVVSSE